MHYRTVRKFTALEGAMLDYIDVRGGIRLGQILDHFSDRNPAYVISTFQRLRREGWIVDYDIGHGTTNRNPQPSHQWRWVADRSPFIEPLDDPETGHARPFCSFGPLTDVASLQRWLDHLQHKTWFSAGDERVIVALYQERFGSFGGPSGHE
ncbi:MAG TPA: hypothetical protein VHU83_06775 [Bryobacteraceae bacterium]|jgi:hypothetical protein|nr:hypothetical protein [Bryobacteraceae bacterium]